MKVNKIIEVSCKKLKEKSEKEAMKKAKKIFSFLHSESNMVGIVGIGYDKETNLIYTKGDDFFPISFSAKENWETNALTLRNQIKQNLSIKCGFVPPEEPYRVILIPFISFILNVNLFCQYSFYKEWRGQTLVGDSIFSKYSVLK